MRKIIYTYLNLKNVKGFIAKGKYLADKYNLNFIYQLNKIRKKIIATMIQLKEKLCA